MDHMSWVTSWEKWREAMGPRGSRHRRDVEVFLSTHPALLYWGDSWFSTPLYLNLARHSASRINGMGMLIGKPGAMAQELFEPANVHRIVGRLLGSPFDVLLLSAGGNDSLSERLADAFRPWQGNANASKLSAAQAFQHLVDFGTFATIFDAYDGLLTALGRVADARPTFRVVSHPYVAIERIGVKADLTTANIGLIAWLKGDVGPWLWPPMRWVVDDMDEAREFARLLLQVGFGQRVLAALARKYSGLFSIADFSAVAGTDLPTFWNDEIHPTEEGFRRLSEPFNAQIKRVLPQGKQGAIQPA